MNRSINARVKCIVFEDETPERDAFVHLQVVDGSIDIRLKLINAKRSDFEGKDFIVFLKLSDDPMADMLSDAEDP